MREHGHPFEARRAFLIAQMNLSGATADRILAEVEEAEVTEARRSLRFRHQACVEETATDLSPASGKPERRRG